MSNLKMISIFDAFLISYIFKQFWLFIKVIIRNKKNNIIRKIIFCKYTSYLNLNYLN